MLFGLVDHPSKRKQHVGKIPLVGGLAIFMGVTVGAACYGQFHWFEKSIISTAALLTFIGALDDRFDLSVRGRLFIQAASVVTVIAVSGVYIHTLGTLFGHDIELEWLGPPVTIIAIIGLVNAFNMMDGIDGLAGSLALVSIAAIAMFVGTSTLRSSLVLLILLAMASLPYLLANLGVMGNKIFLGDAGSMLIGYLLAWTLIRMSQVPESNLSPVDVLWCVGLPVCDTLSVMCRRMSQGKSPFKPDRGHIHHILMRAGLGPRSTLVVLIAIAVSIAFVGATLRDRVPSPGARLATFIVLMFAYGLFTTRAWLKQEAAQHEKDLRAQPASIPRGVRAATRPAANTSQPPINAAHREQVAAPPERPSRALGTARESTTTVR
ncbi:MraY family glycosyltransferase [Dyella telluris]|uniref:MraY family glycosyltransferase n=1 Tax=Dyella telluris TaxID=2763498 RepID=UPI001EE4F54A|nr:MraY family glycosyltransferase [Dyella telluris]